MNLPHPRISFRAALAVLLLVAVVSASIHAEESPPPAIDFNRDIRPILFSRCVSCHGPDLAARKGGLDLSTETGSRAALRGGDHAIVPGSPAGSELLARVRDTDLDLRMPPPEKGDPLTAREIATLTQWIEQGAEYAPHWAWIPPTAEPSPDPSAHPIDAFIDARARDAGLSLAPRAERTALIRRASLDLTGLPPTLDEVDAFLTDARPDAFEHLVDRLLASPHFGERFASVWLDLARYADTRGYEADRGRTMWPWRDQLIRALDADQPFDQFTLEQLAGDLLPDPTEEQLLATAFHRNTMTNDEGGTDDEEFRVAAVLDRVDTTMQVWMGLTAGCAQCHDHKYDPLSAVEYYSLAAFFDQTEDADRNDEAPTLAVLSPEDRATVRGLREQRVAARDALARRAAEFKVEAHPGSDKAPEPLESLTSLPWIGEGETPVGADLRVDGRPGPWPWRKPTDSRGGFGSVIESRAAAAQVSQVFFDHALFARPIAPADRIRAWVWLDPNTPPDTIMLQIHTRDGGWHHRAVWGDDAIEFGEKGTVARHLVGGLPTPGEWTPISIPIGVIGIAPPDAITGIALTQRGGRVEWGPVAHETTVRPDERALRSFEAFVASMQSDARAPLPAELRAIVAKENPDAAELASLRTYFVTRVHPRGREQFRSAIDTIATLDQEISAIEMRTPRVPILRERAPDERRTTTVLRLGNFLDRGEEVAPATPAIFPSFPSDAPRDRRGLARWLVSPENPLTARVQVNRIWEQLFGRGLVETVEDFGTQGFLPSHPALLDHLALEYIAGGWRLKPLLRHIATSETYRRSASSTPEQRALDPRNVLLSWSPRTRLSAEQVRDQALAIGGLLSEKKFGPPVFPPQPEGVWQIVYSGDQWRESKGEDRTRRAIYTFWRRTSPYPSALTFDATSRELCAPRRIRSSTPLQALVTMNDPVFLESAGGLAGAMARVATSGERSRAIAHGFRRATARLPREDETEILLSLFERERDAFSKDATRTEAALRAARIAATDTLPAVDLAAWTVVAQVILQLDEVWTRP